MSEKQMPENLQEIIIRLIAEGEAKSKTQKCAKDLTPPRTSDEKRMRDTPCGGILKAMKNPVKP